MWPTGSSSGSRVDGGDAHRAHSLACWVLNKTELSPGTLSMFLSDLRRKSFPLPVDPHAGGLSGLW